MLNGFGGYWGETASNPSTSTGITLAAGNQTKGSYVQCIASCAQDVHWLVVNVYSSYTAFYVGLIDIAIGASGSEVVIIPNLSVYPGLCPTRSYTIPVRIPKGSRISARAQYELASVNCFITISTIGPSLFAECATGTVDSLTANPATSRGLIVDAGATVNTYGAWTEVTASTDQAYQWLIVATGSREHQGGGDTLAYTAQMGIGTSGSEVLLIGVIWCTQNSSQDYNNEVFHFPAYVPAGSRLSIRMQCTVNNVARRKLDFYVYGCS